MFPETINNLISGQVTDGATPLADSLISAQVYPPDSLADANGVFVQSATLTDVNGMYIMYVPPKHFNVVAVKTGYEPQCATVDASGFGEHVKDFTLLAAPNSGTVSGNLTGLTGTETSATIGVLRTMDCGNGEVPVQIDSQNVAEGGNFIFTLSPGDYSLVITAEGETTQVYPITVTAGQDTQQDINFQ